MEDKSLSNSSLNSKSIFSSSKQDQVQILILSPWRVSGSVKNMETWKNKISENRLSESSIEAELRNKY